MPFTFWYITNVNGIKVYFVLFISAAAAVLVYAPGLAPKNIVIQNVVTIQVMFLVRNIKDVL